MADILYYVCYMQSFPFILLCIGSLIFYRRERNSCFIVMTIASFIASLNSISLLIWPQSTTYDMNNKIIARSDHLFPFYMHWFIGYAMLLAFALALLIYALKTAKHPEQKDYSEGVTPDDKL